MLYFSRKPTMQCTQQYVDHDLFFRHLDSFYCSQTIHTHLLVANPACNAPVFYVILSHMYHLWYNIHGHFVADINH